MIGTSERTWEHIPLTLAEAGRHQVMPAGPLPSGDPALLQKAYAHCESVIAEHGKTFNMASSLLPPDKRRAIRALYAFCRVSDDIVDCGSTTRESREVQLSIWRRTMLSAPPRQNDLIATAWTDARLRYKIPSQYADQLIDGVSLDLCDKRYETFDELAVYAYEVASTVGLMSMHIIGLAPGASEEEAIPFIVRLGVALQITNILRDIGEDLRSGRVYLPQAELASFDLSKKDLEIGRVDDRWRAFMRFQIGRNRALYREAWPGVALFHRDGRFAVAAACALYSAILDDIEAHDYDVFSRRAHISTWGKLRRLPGIWLRNR
jgi:15-cis-phytoene synthase